VGNSECGCGLQREKENDIKKSKKKKPFLIGRSQERGGGGVPSRKRSPGPGLLKGNGALKKSFGKKRLAGSKKGKKKVQRERIGLEAIRTPAKGERQKKSGKRKKKY